MAQLITTDFQLRRRPRSGQHRDLDHCAESGVGHLDARGLSRRLDADLRCPDLRRPVRRRRRGAVLPDRRRRVHRELRVRERYAGELPGSVLAVPLRLAFTFVAPATITGYAPALLILQLPGPAFLPAWLGWCAPLFAGTTWLLAGLAWRAGIRRFTGAGG